MKRLLNHLWLASIALNIISVPGSSGAEEHVIVMPPFLVEEERTETEPDWIYGKSGNLEVLSECAKDETQEFVTELRGQLNQLRVFIPEEFLTESTVPTTLILLPQSRKQMLDEAMQHEFDRMPNAPVGKKFTPLNDLRLSDPDSTYILVVLDDWDWQTYKWKRDQGRMQASPFVRSPVYVQFLLGSLAPALPDWYIVGATRLYETIVFETAVPRPMAPGANVEPAPAEGRFDPEPWTSSGAAAALRRRPDSIRTLVPLSELFTARGPVGKSPEYRRVWEAQAELFVRWALSEDMAKGRERLARFATGATRVPTTEDFFHNCFGLDYSSGMEALSDFLPHAVREGLSLGPSTTPPGQLKELRAAVTEEVDRIRAEWSRRALRVIKEDNPSALALYTDKTRMALERDFQRGERSSELLATLVLFRLENGDPTGGYSILEKYPEVGISRPIVAMEVAQHDLLEALQHPAGINGALGETQAAKVESEISPALDGPLPIEGGYLIAARVCEHLGRVPSRAELRRLVEGAELFPRNSQLVIQCASWELREGNPEIARRLVEFGLWENIDPSAREKLVTLEELCQLPAAEPNPINSRN